MHTPDTCRCSCHLVSAADPRHRCAPASYTPQQPSPGLSAPSRPRATPPARSAPLREEAIERYLDTLVRRHGGITFKFAPLVAGNPDRIVLAPHGAIHLVELKAPGGALRPDQVLWHSRALKVGHYVHILSSKSDVDAFVRWAVRNATTSRRPTTPHAYDQQSPDAFEEEMAR